MVNVIEQGCRSVLEDDAVVYEPGESRSTRALFVAQATFYLVAALAYVLERRDCAGQFIPLYFFVVNLAPLLAVRALLRGEQKATWETGRTEPPSGRRAGSRLNRRAGA